MKQITLKIFIHPSVVQTTARMNFKSQYVMMKENVSNNIIVITTLLYLNIHLGLFLPIIVMFFGCGFNFLLCFFHLSMYPCNHGNTCMYSNQLFMKFSWGCIFPFFSCSMVSMVWEREDIFLGVIFILLLCSFFMKRTLFFEIFYFFLHFSFDEFLFFFCFCYINSCYHS